MSEPASGQLLAVAASVLRGQAYKTVSVPLRDSTTVLLAEDECFAIALVQFADPGELRSIEGAAAEVLSMRMSHGSGAKRWDAYLVLLSTSGGLTADDLLPEDVASIVYNTKFFRRIVRWNVRPEEESVARALRSFLPLTSARLGPADNPLDRLIKGVTSFGVSTDQATAALQRWRASAGGEA